MKSNGRDHPNVEFLRKCWHIIGDSVCEVVKESIRQSKFPEQLKIASITPIPKVANTTNLNEIRPINVLPTIEKIIEECVKIQLLKFTKVNNLLSDVQHGFREKHSTETAINNILNIWSLEMDKGNCIIAVFIDLKRAFETIDRDILLYKLDFMGFRSIVLEWIRNYFTNRKQKVKLKNKESDLSENKFGVAQGSKIGPLLFVLFINEITSILKYSKIQLFADDTLIFLTCQDLDDGIRKINEDLAIVEKWLCINKLCVNKKKSKWMLISYAQNNSGQVKLGDDVLDEVHEIKYLGIIIDSRLNFNLEYRQTKSFFHIGVSKYNKLPDKIKNSKSVNEFRKLLFGKIMSEY